MSTATAPKIFVETLQKSGLFTAQEYQDLMYLVRSAGLHPADNKGVATWCVHQGYLTKFQAKELLAGKWRNFILNNKYKVLEPLGAGGMGAVFRCQHISLRKEVALKVLPTELTQNPAALQRFLREAQALAALDHPNIVQAHDVDEHRGQYILVMSCVDGWTLLDLVRQNGPLASGLAAEYIVQACRGLQHAHEAGWVHRDLKPGNLILDNNGVLKIMDFGLARLATADGSVTQQFADCNVLGSPDYISPEQAMNRPDIDIRADIYSLGATLYFLLSGRAPFEGEPLLQKLLAHQMREPEEVAMFRSDLPAGLIQVMKRMMAKQPDARFATPRDVEAALQLFAQTLPPAKAPSTANRIRGSRTLRVPQVDSPPLDGPAPILTPAPQPAPYSPPPAPYHPEPAPYSTETTDEEDVGITLSPQLKRWLLIGAGAVVLLTLSILGLIWLTSAPDRTARLERADALGRRQQWKGAAALYADLLKEATPNSKEYNEIYHRIKGWGPVAVHLLEHFPQDTELNRTAAAYYTKNNEPEKAVACLEHVLAGDPGNADLWHELSGAMVLQRNWRKAADSLERACRGKPENAEWSRDRGFVYAVMGDWENYRRVCRETFEQFGQKDKTWGQRIEVAYVFGQGSNPPALLNQVVQLGREMAEQNPGDTNHLFRYGVAQYRAGKLREAYDTLKQAQGDEQAPGYEPRRSEPVLAMILFQQGQKDEARRLLSQFRQWYDGEVAKKTKTPFIPVLGRWWDSLALDNLYREAEALIEGKPRT